MIGALALFGYALGAAWCVPALLAPLTRRGASPRLGLAAWLTGTASVLAAAALGIASVIGTAAADWPQLTKDLCRSVAGQGCTPEVYGSALYSAGVAILAAGVTLAALVALWRYGRRLQRARQQTRTHADIARITGHALPGTGAVVLDDPRPAAYCVAGHPAAIVITSGALAVLDQPQLAAVLAHERAHLAHRHHLLTMATRGLAAAFPGVPLFARGSAEVARLAEMAADDAAARGSDRPTVIAALLALATGTVIPAATLTGALAAATQSVPARVERMLAPARPVTSAAFAAALVLTAAALAAAPVALTVQIVG
jgi:beta-lactamase regulating signal transducer with metallopeptidase domain